MSANAAIMIVEDEAIVALEIEERLKAYGYEVVASVASGEEAIRVALTAQLDLILMDIRLEGRVNGIEASEKINSMTGVPIIFLTAYSDDSTLEQAAATRPYGYLLKPFRERELHTTITMALRKSEMDQIIATKEENFRLFFENAPIYGYMVSMDGNIIDVNNTALAVLNYSKEMLVGQSIKTLYPADYSLITEQELTDLKNGKVISNREIDIITANHARRTVNQNATLVKTPEGSQLFLLFLQEDITKNKEMEETIVRRKEWFRAIFEESPIAINVFDSNGKLVLANRACLDMFGVKETSDLGQLNLFSDPNTAEWVKEKIKNDQQVRYESAFDFSMVQRDKLYVTEKQGIMWLDAVLSPLRYGESKELQGYIVQMQDITSQKKSEEILTQSEENYRTLAECSLQGIGIYQKEMFVYSNQALANIWGYSIDEILALGREQLWQLVHPDDAAILKEVISRFNDGYEISEHHDFRITHKDGSSRWIESYFTSVEYNEEKAIQMIQIDKTERILAEKRIEHSHDRAEFFLDLMSHDLSNINQAVYGIFDLLLFDTSISNSTREILKEGLYQMIRSNRLIKNVQKFKKVEDTPKELTATDPYDALLTAVEQVQGDMPFKKLNLKTKAKSGKYKILADEYLIDVFYAILHNAVRFDPNPQVDVDFSMDMAKDKSKIRIEVADHGAGIPDETKNSLFGRVSLLKKGYLGTGISLTLLNLIINHYEGQVHVEDRVPGDYKQGVKFILEIPRASLD